MRRRAESRPLVTFVPEPPAAGTSTSEPCVPKPKFAIRIEPSASLTMPPRLTPALCAGSVANDVSPVAVALSSESAVLSVMNRFVPSNNSALAPPLPMSTTVSIAASIWTGASIVSGASIGALGASGVLALSPPHATSRKARERWRIQATSHASGSMSPTAT